MIEFGHSLRQLRTDRHLTQQAVADKLGLTRQTISKWENGKGYPDFENLLLLCAVYDVSIDQVLNPQTLHLNPQEKIRSNQRREHTLMLTKQANRFVIAIAAVLAVIISITLVNSYREELAEYNLTRTHFVTVVHVKNVDYTHDAQGYVRKVKRVILNDGTTLLYPTIADLRQHDLVIPARKPFTPGFDEGSNLFHLPATTSIFKSALLRNSASGR
ncbi:helix-turn-helix transcriptional regulator [Schleiferilactobacillus shenzhenensis]|nr:helix-turn-helix transcriptional regulator [Schleiferilactobacillus shenzhenensis]